MSMIIWQFSKSHDPQRGPEVTKPSKTFSEIYLAINEPEPVQGARYGIEHTCPFGTGHIDGNTIKTVISRTDCYDHPFIAGRFNGDIMVNRSSCGGVLGIERERQKDEVSDRY